MLKEERYCSDEMKVKKSRYQLKAIKSTSTIARFPWWIDVRKRLSYRQCYLFVTSRTPKKTPKFR